MVQKYHQNINELLSYAAGGIVSRELVKNNGDLTLFLMAKGTAISDHASSRAGLVLAVDGQGVFRLEQEEIKMTPGVLIKMPQDAVHSIRAEENTAFLLFLNSQAEINN